jgi:hypothetical protein
VAEADHEAARRVSARCCCSCSGRSRSRSPSCCSPSA